MTKTAVLKQENQLQALYNNMPNFEKEAFRVNIMEETGRSQSTVFLWIRGGNPSYSEKKIIAEYLGQTVYFLFSHLEK